MTGVIAAGAQRGIFGRRAPCCAPGDGGASGLDAPLEMLGLAPRPLYEAALPEASVLAACFSGYEELVAEGAPDGDLVTQLHVLQLRQVCVIVLWQLVLAVALCPHPRPRSPADAAGFAAR